MASGGEPSRGDYDAIVVGAGLGGLATAALLAFRGRSVLVAERHGVPGGYGSPFRRGSYLFDAAVHTFPEGEYVENFFDYLGLGDRLDIVSPDVPFRAVYPDYRLTFTKGLPALEEALAADFPDQADSLRSFFALRDRIFEEAASVPHKVGIGQLDAAARAFPTLFEYRTATLGRVLDEHVPDPRVRAVLGSLWPYVGTPPERAGFIHYSQHLGAFMVGANYAVGSFGTAVDALIAGLERDGGELIVGRPVAKILIEDGAAAGVRLEDGSELRAPLVISNADATHTWEELVGTEHLPRGYQRRLQRLKPSLSACVLYTATTLPLSDLGPTHEIFLYTHWDHTETYQDILDFKPGGMWVSIPSILDPSLAPEGESIVTLSSLAVHDDEWSARADGYRELVLDRLEALFPGFRDHLSFAELATPQTLERYTGNRAGAIYGWENTPRQTGSGRLAHVTPVDGLLLTGHWTQEGGGFLRALVGGDVTVQHILREAGEQPLPSFRPSYMPALTDFEAS